MHRKLQETISGFLGLTLLVFLFLPSTSVAQEEKKKETRNFASVTYALTFIPKGMGGDNFEHRGHFVPGLGLDYLRRFNEKWEAGVMVDWEFGTYLIPREMPLLREDVIIGALVIAYSPIRNWAIFTGPGFETDSHHSFFIYRIGTEYAFPLPNNWAIPAGVFWDFKKGYDAWSLNFGIGRNF